MWLRQEYAAGKFDVVYLKTNDMPADGLTKALPRQKFEHFRMLLNLQDIQSLVTREDVKQGHIPTNEHHRAPETRSS